jgi:hypothetical protein
MKSKPDIKKLKQSIKDRKKILKSSKIIKK